MPVGPPAPPWCQLPLALQVPLPSIKTFPFPRYTMLPPPPLILFLFLSSQTLPSDFHRTDSFLLLRRSLCHLLWEASRHLWISSHAPSNQVTCPHKTILFFQNAYDTLTFPCWTICCHVSRLFPTFYETEQEEPFWLAHDEPQYLGQGGHRWMNERTREWVNEIKATQTVSAGCYLSFHGISLPEILNKW